MEASEGGSIMSTTAQWPVSSYRFQPFQVHRARNDSQWLHCPFLADRILECELLNQEPLGRRKTGSSMVIAIANILCSAIALQPMSPTTTRLIYSQRGHPMIQAENRGFVDPNGGCFLTPKRFIQPTGRPDIVSHSRSIDRLIKIARLVRGDVI